MKTSSADSLFDTESIWAILLRIAPPVMLAQLIQAMYNIVDSYFVGQYSNDGLTALSIIYPVQLIVTAIAVGTGVGVNTLMSHLDGRGKHHTADRTAGMGTVLALLSWAVFALLSAPSDAALRPLLHRHPRRGGVHRHLRHDRLRGQHRRISGEQLEQGAPGPGAICACPWRLRSPAPSPTSCWTPF